LAARSIVEGLDYDQLIERELAPFLKSSLVNRYIYEKLGNRGYRWVIHRWEQSSDILVFMKKRYCWSFY
jgi:hypothetical protein